MKLPVKLVILVMAYLLLSACRNDEGDAEFETLTPNEETQRAE